MGLFAVTCDKGHTYQWWSGLPSTSCPACEAWIRFADSVHLQRATLEPLLAKLHDLYLAYIETIPSWETLSVDPESGEGKEVALMKAYKNWLEEFNGV